MMFSCVHHMCPNGQVDSAMSEGTSESTFMVQALVISARPVSVAPGCMKGDGRPLMLTIQLEQCHQ